MSSELIDLALTHEFNITSDVAYYMAHCSAFFRLKSSNLLSWRRLAEWDATQPYDMALRTLIRACHPRESTRCKTDHYFKFKILLSRSICILELSKQDKHLKRASELETAFIALQQAYFNLDKVESTSLTSLQNALALQCSRMSQTTNILKESSKQIDESYEITSVFSTTMQRASTVLKYLKKVLEDEVMITWSLFGTFAGICCYIIARRLWLFTVLRVLLIPARVTNYVYGSISGVRNRAANDVSENFPDSHIIEETLRNTPVLADGISIEYRAALQDDSKIVNDSAIIEAGIEMAIEGIEDIGSNNEVDVVNSSISVSLEPTDQTVALDNLDSSDIKGEEIALEKSLEWSTIGEMASSTGSSAVAVSNDHQQASEL